MRSRAVSEQDRLNANHFSACGGMSFSLLGGKQYPWTVSAQSSRLKQGGKPHLLRFLRIGEQVLSLRHLRRSGESSVERQVGFAAGIGPDQEFTKGRFLAHLTFAARSTNDHGLVSYRSFGPARPFKRAGRVRRHQPPG